MIEVHPKFSEVPHLRSSIPHPRTDVSTNRIASRWIIPSSPKSKKKKHPFSKQDFGIPTILVLVREPRHSENILAEMCYLYRRTRRPLIVTTYRASAARPHPKNVPTQPGGRRRQKTEKKHTHTGRYLLVKSCTPTNIVVGRVSRAHTAHCYTTAVLCTVVVGGRTYAHALFLFSPRCTVFSP